MPSFLCRYPWHEGRGEEREIRTLLRESEIQHPYKKAEFLPAAGNPEYGSLDLCLAIEGSIEDAEKEIKEKNGAIEEGPVTRHGALGEMKSIYLRDPDGNLIELASYEG